MKSKIFVSLGLAFLPVLGFAQREIQIFRGAFGRGTLEMQLLEEITVLQRLVPLQLTEAQIEQMLAAYAQHPASSEQAEIIARLQEIKQQLLSGERLVAADLANLRELARTALQERRRLLGQAPAAPATAPPSEALSPLEQALWNLLTVPQRAVLLGDVRGAAANNQKADQQLSRRALQLIGQMLPYEEAKWQQARDKLIAALIAGVGAENSPERDNARQLFVEFFERLRRMKQAEFAQRQEELAAELLALLPPQTNLAVALAEYNPQLIKEAMARSLTHPRAPDLLRQIREARGAKATAQQEP